MIVSKEFTMVMLSLYLISFYSRKIILSKFGHKFYLNDFFLKDFKNLNKIAKSTKKNSKLLFYYNIFIEITYVLTCLAFISLVFLKQ